ncbi:transposon ty3-G gag-pol polyprotein [Tanacetum coccineum]
MLVYCVSISGLSSIMFQFHFPPVTNEYMILPQAVIDHRHKEKYRPKLEVLVIWKGARIEDATWENEWRFRKSCPDFILADKDSKREALMCKEYVK